jgi:hypothetical protein
MTAEDRFSMDEIAGLRRCDRVSWGIIGAVAAIVLLAPIVTDFRIVWSSFTAVIATATVLIAGTWYYDRRREARLASTLGITAQIMMFFAVGAPLSYLAASLNLPLQDHALDATDKSLGLDWLGLLEWLRERPAVLITLRIFYQSFSMQAALTVLVLAFTGRLAWLRVFVLAFFCTAIVTIAISAALPAEGVWRYYELTTDATSFMPVTSQAWPVYHDLRDGTFRALMAAGAEGIITFPSLHAAVAVILGLAMWPVPVARWFALAATAFILAGTPIDGAHYFVDVFAGIAIAVLSWMASRALVRHLATPVNGEWIAATGASPLPSRQPS